MVASYLNQPDTLPTLHSCRFPTSRFLKEKKKIHSSPPYSRVVVVIEGAGLHRLWGGLTFGRVWEAADVRVGQDVCKSSPGSCFSDHSNWSLAAALTLNAKHTDRHNLSMLTLSLTHKLFVNIICRHAYDWTSAHRPIKRTRKHTHTYGLYRNVISHNFAEKRIYFRNFMVHPLGRQRACSELQKQTFVIITKKVYEIKDLNTDIVSCSSMCVSVCVCKLYMYRLFLNEVQQDVIRGSIGLADGAGTPLKQGQDIPLTGAKHQAEGGWARDTSESETGRSETLRKAILFFSFFFPVCISSLPSLSGCEEPDQRGESTK